ncbi:MAG: site-specific integrase [Actinomycetota bacterium]|nr:site-specific integrase [Actinomycetota bacterium]
MADAMVKTKHPGIYRRGTRYVVVYRVEGRQRKEFCRTLDEARRLKAARQTDIGRGEFHEQSRVSFGDYAAEWVERYRGRGRRGFRESTRDDYRRLLREFAFPFFAGRTLTQIGPRDVARFVDWLCDAREQGRALSDSTVRNIVNPVRACMATAMQEGLIRSNPTHGVTLPFRPRVEESDDEEVKALHRDQLAAFLAVVHPRHRVMFKTLAATGLRISELIALQWRHVKLEGSRPVVRVRRAIVRGREHLPKSRHSRREVPLDVDLVRELRAHRTASEWGGEEDLVFPSMTGTPLMVENLRRRVLAPVAEEVGVPWIGFHTFRHTCASMLFERGANAVQVQRWLGHHSPAFTLATYVHLLSDDLGDALSLDVELEGNKRATAATGTDAKQPTATPVDLLH